jgi:hypothetical protein
MTVQPLGRIVYRKKPLFFLNLKKNTIINTFLNVKIIFIL